MTFFYGGTGMKKKMKIVILFMLCIVSVFIFIFVFMRTKKNADGEVTSVISKLYSETEDGVFYTDISYDENVNFTIRYIDYNTNKDVVVCDKPNCTHENEECNGYYCSLSTNNFITSLFTFNEKLYVTYIENDTDIAGVSSVTLYEQDYSGNNRKALFKTDHEVIQDYVIADNVLYYITAYCDKEYMKQFENRTDMMSLTQEESDGIETHQCSSLWAYDFSTGKNYIVIEKFGEYNSNLGGTGIIPYIDDKEENKKASGFYIYQEIYGESGFERTVYYYYNINDKKIETDVFPEIADYNLRHSNAQCIYDNRYYFISRISGEYMQICYDIDLGEYNTVATCEDIPDVFLMDDKIIYNFSNEVKTDYIYYDLKSEEFYSLNDGAAVPVYSSKDRGIVDYVDLNATDTAEYHNYAVVDMNEYFRENFHLMEDDINGINVEE